MKMASKVFKAAALAGTAAVSLAAVTTSANAGGFEVSEQGAYFQGLAGAGTAAGGPSLSSMFWNPAAAGFVKEGITSESNYALVLPESNITVTGFGAPGNTAICGAFDCKVDIGEYAIVPASYFAYRWDDKTVFAMSLNSQYGLGTKPDNLAWAGALHARTAELFTIQATPTVAYTLAPGITVGAGLQLQYFDLKRLKSAAIAPNGPTAKLEGDDTIGVGFTLGVNFNPNPGTSIGLGFRSKIEHDLDGSVSGAINLPITADVETPEKVTLSIRQALTDDMRILGTVAWTNWSRLGIIPINGLPNGVLDLQWEDGWLFSLGGEYDYSSTLQFRAGVAYEISPIQDDTARLVQLPDADRIWIAVGASYKWSEDTTLDFAYSHVFVEEASLIRTNVTQNAPLLFADVDSSVDIISVGIRTKMDWLLGQ